MEIGERLLSEKSCTDECTRKLEILNTSDKLTSSESKPTRKNKKQASFEARNLMTASQSVTEVGTSTAIVYPGAKSTKQVNNGNKLRINGKVTTMPTIGGATWDYPLALISKDSKNQDKKN